MNFVDYFDLFGVKAMQVSCIKGKGAPTTATGGAAGMLYMDTDTGAIYKCTAVVDEVYTWAALGSSGGMSTQAANLLLTILRNGVYTSDQSANIAALKAALASGGSTPDEGGGDSGDTDITEDGGNVTVTGATATDDGNGNVTVTGMTATDDGNGNITVS